MVFPPESIFYSFFAVGVYEEGFCVSRGFGPQNVGCGAHDHGRDVDKNDEIHS
jgi:hypothetical protein